MLEKFRAAKAAEIAALKSGACPAGKLHTGKRPSLKAALSAPGCAVIAEYKRASPSLGDINLALTPEQAAAVYKAGGAAALSCLTEETYFKGSLDYLNIVAASGLPVLRKDFIFDPVQLEATAGTRASAVLLIARCFPDWAELARMNALAAALGLEAVVEIFDERDLDAARRAAAEIIQVNNRDLDTLAMDMDNAVRLIKDKRPGEVWIAASGIKDPDDVARFGAMGYDAVLVGTLLMRQGEPARIEAMLRALADAGKAVGGPA